MSESGWRSRLLQTVGKGLLRLGTYFVRQAETPPAASSSPPDAPPWLPPEFWQQSRPPAHWLALLAESQIPLQWVGTSGPPPLPPVIPAAAAGIEETTDDAGSVTLPLPPIWAAPDYAPAAPAQAPPTYTIPPQNQRPTPGTGRGQETGRGHEAGRIRGEPQGGESAGSQQPPAAARLMPTPEINAPQAPAAPLYAPVAPTAAAPAPAFASPPPASSREQMPALFQTPARSLTDDAAPPLPGRVADAPPGTSGDSRPAPEYGVSWPPPAPDAYRLPLASRSAPGVVLDAPPPVFASPAANPHPTVSYPPPSLLPPEPAATTPSAGPPTRPRQPQAAPRYFEPPSTRYAAPGYEDAPSQDSAAPPVYAGWQSLPAPLGAESPPPADRWPALPPLFADAGLPGAAPPAAQPEHLRQQRLEQEQRGERG